MKRTATRHIARVRAAIAEVQASDLATGVDARSRRGTARVPPRRGDRAARGDRRPLPVPAHRAAVPARRRRDGRDARPTSRPTRVCRRTSRWPAPSDDTEAPPTLVDNVETLAHVTVALAEGADWFREVGTDESPGTVLCTVSGCVDARRRRRVHDGNAAARDHRDARRRRRGPAARSGPCSRARRPRSSPPTSSTRPRAGKACRRSAPGSARPRSSCSTTRPTSPPSARACRGSSRSSRAGSARRASRTACSSPTRSTRIAASEGTEDDLDVVRTRIETVTFGARCSLATQEQVVIGSMLDAFGAELEARVEHTAHARRAAGDRPDARPPRRRRDARRRSTRASSPTGRSATTGRASRPPTASTTTAPTTKTSDPHCIRLPSVIERVETERLRCGRSRSTTSTCSSRSTPTRR